MYCTACLMDKMYMYNIAAAHFFFRTLFFENNKF